MNKNSVSVIVCTRNRLEYLVRFIKTLYSQTEIPCELVIVDSSDIDIFKAQTFKREILSKSGNIKVKCIRSEKGLTLQRNIGIDNSAGEILYFFDDDIVLSNNYLEVINSVYRQSPAYYGGSGNITNLGDSSRLQMIFYKIKAFFLLSNNYGDGRFYPSGWPKWPYKTSSFREVEVLGGGLTSWRREVFDEFRFDEYFSGYGALEDVEFSCRVSRKYKLFYNPNATCIHAHGATERLSNYKLHKQLMMNYRYHFKKNFYSNNPFYIFPHYFSLVGYVLLSRRFDEACGKLSGLLLSIFRYGI